MTTPTKKKPSEKVTFHIPATRELIAKIDRIAERENRSRANMIVTMLTKQLEQTEQRA